MKIQTVSCICFSPTGTTETISEHIAKGMGVEHIEIMDCTKRSDREKFERLDSPDSADAIKVPGNVPYVAPKNLIMLKEARKSVPLTPETDADLCIQCGQCVEVCPSGAVSLNGEVVTDRWGCAICFASVRNCPTGARQMTEPNFAKAIQHLYEICRERKEPELFL